jgi:hypothetical protein
VASLATTRTVPSARALTASTKQYGIRFKNLPPTRDNTTNVAVSV